MPARAQSQTPPEEQRELWGECGRRICSRGHCPGGENKKNSQATKTERERKKKLARQKAKEKAKRAKTIADRAASSESRRVKRIAARRVHTTCFACREVGHSAKDCPSISVPRPDGEEEDDDDDDDKGGGTTNAKIEAVVGMCYRCGSGKHNLARCRQPAPPDGALPFASCFVCSRRGHLAGSCPRNNGKGVYPNGGACKLCGETTHLAKNCTLRKIEGNAVATLLGTGREAGADEDDFHTIRRKNAEIDWHEHGEERARKEAKVGAGALTGVVKAFGKAPARPKKVVSF
ncbi:hypothetical protein BC826DRAFT_1103078 [Russula brevipes]|nr:hypothetical protein BC826DRAFT_1103078 [Russula brevipes]